jgi:hypothetical protein
MSQFDPHRATMAQVDAISRSNQDFGHPARALLFDW